MTAGTYSTTHIYSRLPCFFLFVFFSSEQECCQRYAFPSVHKNQNRWRQGENWIYIVFICMFLEWTVSPANDQLGRQGRKMVDSEEVLLQFFQQEVNVSRDPLAVFLRGG